MGFIDWLFSTPNSGQPVSVEKYKEQFQTALNEYRGKAGELASPHLATLAKKKKRLIRIDDYGMVVSDKWNAELKYFCERVLFSNQEMIQLETNALGASSSVIHHSQYTFCPQEPREALIEFIDAIVDIELENIAEEPTSYSENLTPEDYEHFCADILNEAGWIAVVTKGSGDHGIDVIAEKDDFRLAIQCKKYSKPVGNKAVQEAYSGGAFYEANACAVVAPIEYTPAAVELADSLGVHLLHHDDLAGLNVTSPED